jgi:hypothetical protein
MNISNEMLKDLIKLAFIEGQQWGVTYSTWFDPTEADHNKKIEEAIVNAERLLIGKMPTDLLKENK